LSQRSSRIAGSSPAWAGADVGRRIVSSGDLVGEHQQQKIIEGHVLLVGKHEAIGQGLDDASELQALEGGDQVRTERR